MAHIDAGEALSSCIWYHESILWQAWDEQFFPLSREIILWLWGSFQESRDVANKFVYLCEQVLHRYDNRISIVPFVCSSFSVFKRLEILNRVRLKIYSWTPVVLCDHCRGSVRSRLFLDQYEMLYALKETYCLSLACNFKEKHLTIYCQS